MERLEKALRGGSARVRARLSRMEGREAFRAAAFALTLLFAFLLMWRLTALTPLEMDDYDYRVDWSTGEPVASLSDVLASQAAHYRLWGGRCVTHALAQTFLWLDKRVFNLANAAMYALLLLELYALAKPRGRRFCWTLPLAAHAALFCCVPFFGTVFLWLTGSCNYLWGTTLALMPLLILRSAAEGGRFSRGGGWGVLALPVGFIAGWTNENTACAVFAAAFVFLLARRLRGERPAAWQWAMLAAQGAGIALMLAAPGNFVRAGETAEAYALPVRAAQAAAYGVVYLGVPLLAALLLHGLLCALKLKARTGWAALLLFAAAAGALSMAASPVLSDRSYTGPFALALAAALTLLGDMEAGCRATDAHKLAALPLCAALLLYGGMRAVKDVREHGEAWAAQILAVEEAQRRGEDEVSVDSVFSHSRFTMDIAMAQEPSDWPNASLSKAFGVQIRGKQAP